MFFARVWFHCSVSEMLERVTARELVEMEIDYSLEPYGEWRQDLNFGMQTADIATMLSDNKTYKPKQFMPDFDVHEAKKHQLLGFLKYAYAQAKRQARKIMK